MAAPGIGVGDLVKACALIYDLCVKYKDAPKEFDEIAEKAKSTAVVLERIEIESKTSGNLVERAGPQAFTQLQDNLRSLRRDTEKLDTICRKYNKIHDEGPGRRLLFALKESNGLTDLRRKIGLHEQVLTLWYMTLVYGSLRRLEGGQEELLKAIEAMKDLSPRRMQELRRSLYHGDAKPLERELEKKGIPTGDDINVCTAAEYIMADSVDKVRMESCARTAALSSDALRAKSSESDWFLRPDYKPETRLELGRSKSSTHRRPERSYRSGRPDHHTAKDSKRERRHSAYARDYDDEEVIILPGASRRSRRPSNEPQTPLHGPLLVVPDAGPRYRSSSAHEPGDHRPPRSPDRHRSHEEADPVIIVQGSGQRPRRSSSQRSSKSDGHRRDSSTHSYHRVRLPSSSGLDGGSGEKIRMVTKMDRIDSIDPTLPAD